MIAVLRRWYERNFENPQAVILALILFAGLLLLVFAGRLLAPLLAAVVFAYLLDGLVQSLQRLRLPRMAAVIIVYVLFLALLVASVLLLLPVLGQQITQFAREIPGMASQGQRALQQLPERYPQLISAEQVNDIISFIQAESVVIGQQLVNYTVSSALKAISLTVYLVLVPLMVFFLLKDKNVIIEWLSRFLPRERGLAAKVWGEVNIGISSYVRGKFIEILIVWAACFLVFFFFGLDYALLLSFAVGLSVLVPYVGAMVVAAPVAFVAYFQWGIGSEFTSLMIAYLVLQFLDGNVLAPLLFSEVVKLHPVAVISAVVVFGGLWGFLGVFFAIPLATLVQAVIRSWPRRASGDAREGGGHERDAQSLS